MSWLLDEPSVVLVCLTFAAMLFIIEVALPTVGIAGTLGLAALVVVVVAVVDEGMTWWPLIGPAVGVTAWAMLIVAQRRSTAAELFAAAVFALGGAAFSVVNDDAASMVVTVLGTAALAAGFPRLHDAATRLARRPAQVGMEALVGGVAIVDRWERRSGVVLLEGSRWNASAAQAIDLTPGDAVTVIGFHGSTFHIGPRSGDVWPPPRRTADRRSR